MQFSNRTLLRKGTLIYVEGRLKTSSWEDRDGNKRWTTEIIAGNIQMLGGRSERAEGIDRDNGLSEPPTLNNDTDPPF